MLTFPDVVRSGYQCSSEVLIAFQTASTPVLALLLRKQQHFRVAGFKLNAVKEPCKLYMLKISFNNWDGSLWREPEIHLTYPRPSMDMPQAPVAWTSVFDSQKTQQGKLWQKTLVLSLLCEEMEYNQATLKAISQVRLLLCGLTSGGEIYIYLCYLLISNYFPSFSQKPICQIANAYEKEEEKSFFYCQMRLMYNNMMVLEFSFLVDSVAERGSKSHNFY